MVGHSEKPKQEGISFIMSESKFLWDLHCVFFFTMSQIANENVLHADIGKSSKAARQ